jgi:amyloid beta precursor protein binding protein 1
MAAVERSLKERKFDRQMRLWGAHGQANLEDAKFCILGSGPAASETLKNLVLPNVGEFTIVDTATVTARDCGNNFFVTQDDIGKSRAETVCAWMAEMNPDVKGTAVADKSVADLVTEEGLKFFDSFTLVIACQVYGEEYATLAKHLYENNIPMISVRTNGMLATLRVAIRELTIMESHPTNDRTDFYIHETQLAIFPELKEFCLSFDIHTKDLTERTHTPCVAILVQHIDVWKAAHEGKLPESFKEQTEFKDNLRETFGDTENVDNAIHWAFQVYNPPRIDREVRAVLDDPAGETLTAESADFWVLVRALRDFMENEGAGNLPVSTAIPDIVADSKSYVKLKQIYKERAEKDHETIQGYVNKRLTEIGRESGAIAEEIVDRFVKNCRALKVVRMKSFADECGMPDLEHLEEQYFDMSMFEEPEPEDADKPPKPFQPKMIEWYWAHRVADIFYDAEKRLPGIEAESVESDSAKLVEMQTKLFSDLKLDQPVEVSVLAELARFGGSQLHNTGSYIGGVASQVAMKLILRQFYPLNHTLVHDAIYCRTSVFSV